MALQILLLKVDTNQEPQPGDLHPPGEDLLGHYHVTGDYDAVALANVPDELTFEKRNRLPMDGQIFLVKGALPLLQPPPTQGILRW